MMRITNKMQFQIGVIFFLSSFLMSNAHGQSSMGGWTFHVSTKQVNHIKVLNNTLYAAYKNGLLEYDLPSGEKSMINSVNGLSDIGISALGIETSVGVLMVGYENGNLDKIQGNKITNIPSIRLAQIQGSKRINSIVGYKEFVYVATGFGVVKIDPKKDEVRETYNPTGNNDNILDLAILSDTLYIITKNGMMKGYLNNPVLSDPAQWMIDTRVPQDPEGLYEHLEKVGSDLAISKIHPDFGKDSAFVIRNTGLEWVTDAGFEFEINSLTSHGNKLAVNTNGGMFAYGEDFQEIVYAFNSYAQGKFYNAYTSAINNGLVYMADAEFGLIQIVQNDSYTKIEFAGPPKSNFYRVDHHNDNLLVAGGGLSGISNTFNSAGVYRLSENSWTLLDRDNTSGWDTSLIWDYTAVAFHPNKDEFAVGTYSKVPLTVFEGNNKIRAIYNTSNSPLENTILGNQNSFISDLVYDNQGNLFVLNGYSQNTLKVLTAEEKWMSFDLGPNSKGNLTGRMVQDYNGNLWMAVTGKGMVGFNYNETLENPGDDKVVVLNTGANTGALPANNVTALAVDFDNEIWIGTENGFAILYNSNSAFDAGTGDYNAQRIKLEFEGNVEFLLGNTFISDIEVDGGNRKWMGTNGSGIFCLSPDGLTILQNFTKENSPLISNNILDLEIDHKTGEMYIVTDLGLISHRIDASYDDPEYSDVRVFPNPVRPEYDGVITIQGIRFDSDIRVTDIGGNLIYQTTSNGGTATWNGRNLNGEKVMTGVYLIWTASNEEVGRKVGKVAIINN
jgi:hypothetical protein